MSAEETSDFICDMIFSDPFDHRGPMDLGNEDMPAESVEAFLAKCASEFSMAKTGSSAADPTWLEPIGAAPRVELSKAFRERSDKRFELVVEKIRSFFGNHREEAEQAIQLAKDARDHVRQEFIGA